MNKLAAGVFAILCGLRLGEAVQGQWQSLPLLVQSAFAAVLLIRQPVAKGSVSRPARWLAWMVAFAPFAFRIERGHLVWDILAAMGVLISLWGLVALGTSFGIAPADRGLVQRGPYGWVRHPMYLGELVSFIAITLGAFEVRNVLILMLVLVGLIWRIRQEEGCLVGYRTYAGRVRWRLVPYLW